MLTRKPRKGQRIAWRIDGKLKYPGTVRRADESFCWVDHDNGDSGSFIWKFKASLNQLAEVIA